jgi:hypothetical protein
MRSASETMISSGPRTQAIRQVSRPITFELLYSSCQEAGKACRTPTICSLPRRPRYWEIIQIGQFGALVWFRSGASLVC